MLGEEGIRYEMDRQMWGYMVDRLEMYRSIWD